MTAPASVSIIGAGPTGALLSLFLQRRGIRVTLYESRPDPRERASESGRSINLALADRGIHALKAAGVFEHIENSLVPMRGRFIHTQDGSGSLQPYGIRPNEVIYSVSRHRLNQALLRYAASKPGIEMNFEHALEAADFSTGIAHVRDLRRDVRLAVPMRPMLAADGAGSAMRHAMSTQALIEVREVPLEHGYKEMTLPSGPGGSYRLAREALHIWPRGGFMLIALPNEDGSFTATLFLARTGPVSFQSLTTAASIEEFMARNFPDALALMPDCVAEFEHNPTGFLGTVYSNGWHSGGTAALVGDAAHAIVPFHGQGMNCCFEDCLEFDACMDRRSSWDERFAEFYARRKPDTDAIAAMALENYLEMRERVADPKFRLRQSVALELERRFPDRFIPRYSMVMFHHEISYATAARRGALQAQLLDRLTAGIDSLQDVDYDLARSSVMKL